MKRELNFNDREEKAFKDAKETGFVELPVGEYVSILDNVAAKIVGKQNPEKKLMLTYNVTSPEECAGVDYTHFISLENPQAMGVLKGVLRKFGHNPEEMLLSDVPGRMLDCLGHEVHFDIVKNTNNGREYLNCQIKAVVKGEPRKEAEPIEVDDDIPFGLVLPFVISGLGAMFF